MYARCTESLQGESIGGGLFRVARARHRLQNRLFLLLVHAKWRKCHGTNSIEFSRSGSVASVWRKQCAAQQEIGFLERFALSGDRSAVLAELIPGTEEFFYFYCLHHQNEGKLAEAQAVLEQWRAKIGETASVLQMQDRQMLLTYGENPQRSLDYLRDRLGLNLTHAPPSRDRAAELPSTFDNTQLATDKMIERALAQDRALSKIEVSGLPWLLNRELAQDQLRALLNRIDRADLPKIVERIAEELSMEFAREFGWAPVHQKLTLGQLEDLLRLRPQLIEQDGFVRAYAARLAPTEGSSLTDKAELRAYLLRLATFVRKLPQSQNSFKALVIGNLLKLDMSEGKYDRSLFVEYLNLPRSAFYYDLNRFRNAPPPLAELGFAMQPQVALPPIGDDAAMVQRYLEHFLKSADKVDDFAKYWIETTSNPCWRRQRFFTALATQRLGTPN